MDPEYSYAITRLCTNDEMVGIGLAFTLGKGNDLVCQAISELSDIHPQYRWLGPHKRVVHLALSSIVNACFDLWAKARDVPL